MSNQKPVTSPPRQQLSAGRGNQKGAVLISTFIIIICVIAIITSFLYMVSIQTKTRGYDIADAKALWLADAGIQEALYTLKNDAAYQSNPTTINGSLGDGTYSVTASKDGSIYTFTSTGTVFTLQRKVQLNASLTSSVLARSIHADGSIVDLTGSSGVINANISCHVQLKVSPTMTINGTATEGYPMINPTVDFDYYKSLAQAAGQLIVGSYTFQNGTYNGVWYVTSGATIGNNAIINGSIFSDSSIDFADKATGVQINPSALTNYPALAAKNNISTSATGPPAERVGLENSTINGLVLAQNNITFDYFKNSTVNGTVLAGNNFSMQNGSGITVNYNENIFAPMPPTFTYSENDQATKAVVLQKDWNEIAP